MAATGTCVNARVALRSTFTGIITPSCVSRAATQLARRPYSAMWYDTVAWSAMHASSHAPSALCSMRGRRA